MADIGNLNGLIEFLTGVKQELDANNIEGVKEDLLNIGDQSSLIQNAVFNLPEFSPFAELLPSRPGNPLSPLNGLENIFNQGERDPEGKNDIENKKGRSKKKVLTAKATSYVSCPHCKEFFKLK